MIIHVKLVTGDIEEMGAFDYVVMGHKNPLRPKICAETGQTFKKMSSKSAIYPHSSWDLLCAEQYKWKHVACVNVRYKRYPESQYSRISEAIAYGLRTINAESIAILPIRWRYPEYISIGIFYALWCQGFAACLNKRQYPRLDHRNFVIISKDGVDAYKNVVTQDFRALWQYIRKINWVRNQSISEDSFFCKRYSLAYYKSQDIQFQIAETRTLSAIPQEMW